MAASVCGDRRRHGAFLPYSLAGGGGRAGPAFLHNEKFSRHARPRSVEETRVVCCLFFGGVLEWFVSFAYLVEKVKQ